MIDNKNNEPRQDPPKAEQDAGAKTSAVKPSEVGGREYSEYADDHARPANSKPFPEEGDSSEGDGGGVESSTRTQEQVPPDKPTADDGDSNSGGTPHEKQQQ